jgi:hypothetical protein
VRSTATHQVSCSDFPAYGEFNGLPPSESCRHRSYDGSSYPSAGHQKTAPSWRELSSQPIRRGSIDYPVNISDEPIRIIANNRHRRGDTSTAFVTTIISQKRDSHDVLIFILQDRDSQPVLRALYMGRLVSLSIIPDKAERFDRTCLKAGCGALLTSMTIPILTSAVPDYS